jgi:maltose alpha-D-glucosyltransferase/alpha-amylase
MKPDLHRALPSRASTQVLFPAAGTLRASSHAVISGAAVSAEDLWYKHAVMYCLDVETYLDANGDGIGDFQGLRRKLDYLAGIGVTCLWLQPFYLSPMGDNGYDVSDYYSVHPNHGTFGDFVEFMNHAQALGLRVIVDLVVNHTSYKHPWFQAARRDRRSPYRDWYIWADERPANHADGVVFPTTQTTNWTWDQAAGQFYFHRFYEFQPDLNTQNPAVRREIQKIMGFWLELGVSGFRMDAVPFLVEHKGANVEQKQDFELLHEMRNFLQWRRRDAILLAEANVPADESVNYFGDEGERLQMMLNFPVNQRLFYGLATADLGPLKEALEQTRDRHGCAQWVQFLRSHDELDLGRLTEEQRQKVFEAFGPDPDMQLYDRGIRRRLAPMLGGDRRRLEMAFSLLLALPGTPLIQYGDEIGIGEDLSLFERECARTPMQWSDASNGGFTRSKSAVRPVVDDSAFSYRKVNVAVQQRDRDSFLNFVSRRIQVRQECPEIGWGEYQILSASNRESLVLYYEWCGEAAVTVHHFGSSRAEVKFQLPAQSRTILADMFSPAIHSADSSNHVTLPLEGYGHCWFRVGGVDTALDRHELG